MVELTWIWGVPQASGPLLYVPQLTQQMDLPVEVVGYQLAKIWAQQGRPKMRLKWLSLLPFCPDTQI